MKDLNAQYDKARSLFLSLWALFTLLISAVLLTKTHEHTLIQQSQALESAANQVTDKMDRNIDKLQSNLYQLLIDKNASQCTPHQIKSLYDIVFNSPHLSLIELRSTDGKRLCTSEPSLNPQVPKRLTKAAMFGPIQITPDSIPLIAISEPMQHVNALFYIPQALFDTWLIHPNPNVLAVFVQNKATGQHISGVMRDPKTDEWHSSTKAFNLNAYASKSHTLALIPSVSVVVVQAKSGVLASMASVETLVVVLLAIVSALLYYVLNHSLKNHFSLSRAIKLGLAANQFVPFFQPIFDIKTNRYTSAEILMRWQTPEEIIYPDVFIEEAEKTGLIVPMTLQMLESAFAATHTLLHKHPTFSLAINLSSAHFSDPSFFDELETLLNTYALPCQQITLELTERDLFLQTDGELIAILHQLRRRGFELSVDDFGTGHASLSYLQNFPFTILKIDKIFVHAIGTGAVTEKLSRAIIQIAQTLQLKIIAEGVETPEQQKALSNQQVHLMQGWLYAKAVDAKHFIQTIEGH